MEAVSLRAQLVNGRMGGRVIHEIREKYKLEDIRCARLVLSKRQQLAVDAIHSGEFLNALIISLIHFFRRSSFHFHQFIPLHFSVLI